MSGTEPNQGTPQVQTDNSPAFQFDFQNPNTPPPVEPNPDSLADGFLKEVDPAHLEIVQQYVKPWDAQVTKKFQSIHEQYKPYKELGVDVTELQGAWQIAQAFDQDPVGTLQKVFQLYREQGIELNMSDFFDDQNGTPPGTPEPQGQAPISNSGNLPPEILEKLTTMENVLGALAQQEIDRRNQQEVEQNRKQFDDYLDSLKNTHGEFDTTYVAGRIANGVSAEDAIKEFNQMVQSYANSQRNNPAPFILGGGGPPGQVQAVDPSKLTPEQRREYVAARLSQPS